MRLLLFLLALVVALAPASAHRLDEYLQATTIDLGRGHVLLQMRLTPGVAVANRILTDIDANGDGILSAPEQRAYAAQVGGDLMLSLDGVRRGLRPIGLSFAAAGDLRRGVGEIVLDFEAGVSSTDGPHRLLLENWHQRDIAVYLVNTLVPQDRGIGVAAQDRSYDQSSYRLDYTVGERAAAVRPSDPAAGTGRAIARTFFWRGVLHILTGYDHLLFVAALVLGAVTLWDLVKVVTAFTIAHSVTLTLAALGWVHLPPAVIEPVIAGSIVFVAVQNILRPLASRGPGRLAAAFLFGLFHGLGFAGGLLDLLHGMPGGVFLLAILGFSAGIEAGNQIVLVPLFASLRLIDAGLGYRRASAARALASGAIALGGTWYLAQAIFSAMT